MASKKHLSLLPHTMKGTLFFLIAVVLVPLLILQSSVYYFWYYNSLQQEQDAGVEFARVVAAEVNEFVKDVIRQELAIGTSLTSLKPYTNQQANALLIGSLKELPAVKFFIWVAPDGNTLAASEPKAIGTSISSRKYFREIIGGRTWVASGLLKAIADNSEIVAIARGIRDSQGKLLGVVVAAIDPNKLNVFATLKIKRLENSTWATFDRNGTILYMDPRPNLTGDARIWLNKDPLLAEAIAEKKETTGQIIWPINGEKRLVARVPIGETGWVAGTSRPWGVITGPILKKLRIDFATMGGIAIISVGLALIISGRILHPLSKLKEHAIAVGMGNLEHRTEIEGTVEINELADTFNRMAENLRQRQIETEQARNETLKAADALEVSNKELEQFAYVASHDLQEPLRVITGYLQLIEKRYKGRLDAEADEFINFAVDGSYRMQNLITDLLAFSRVTRKGKLFSLIDCNIVLNEAIANLDSSMKATQATVTSGPLPIVMGDPTQLMQVFQNLISNAIKFHGNKRPEIHISALQKASEWLFSVQDHGIGIEDAYKDRIFVIFQRLHSREEYPGTGIGLAICKKVIERHRGRIWVESEPGKGSIFYFTIPDKGG